MEQKIYYICWVDDRPETIKSFDGHLDLLRLDFNVQFIIDIHNNTDDFNVIARNISSNDLIFFVDYNLKNNDGIGIDGHEVIGIIRENNNECKIVFYSSKATQEELREMVKKYQNVIVVLREDLERILISIADQSFFS